MVLQCSLNAWLKGLVSGDQRRLTGSGSTLAACLRRYAVQISSLLYLQIQTAENQICLNDKILSVKLWESLRS